MGDHRELSFQNVVQTILEPEGIKVGGFPDDIFLDLSENDRERLQCNIWQVKILFLLVLINHNHQIVNANIFYFVLVSW